MVQECISTLGKHQNSHLGCCLWSGHFWQSVSNGVASLSLSCRLSVNILHFNVAVSNGVALLSLSCYLSVNVLHLNVVVSNGVTYKSSLLSSRFWQLVSNGVASLLLSCWLSVNVLRLSVGVNNVVVSVVSSKRGCVEDESESITMQSMSEYVCSMLSNTLSVSGSLVSMSGVCVWLIVSSESLWSV